LAASLLPVAASSVEAGDPLLAYGARIVGDDARTRIVIDFDREPRFSVHYIANPERIVIDLPDVGGRSRLEKQGLKVFSLCEFDGD